MVVFDVVVMCGVFVELLIYLDENYWVLKL